MATAEPFTVIETTEGVDFSTHVVLQTSDSKLYKVSKKAAELSTVVAGLLNDDEQTDSAIPVTSVDAETMDWVARYITHYATTPLPPAVEKPLKKTFVEDIPAFDKELVYGTLIKEGEPKPLTRVFQLLMAANFLNIESLRDLCCATVAHQLRGLTPDEIKTVFGVTEPFTPEFEAEVEGEYPWLKEDNLKPTST